MDMEHTETYTHVTNVDEDLPMSSAEVQFTDFVDVNNSAFDKNPLMLNSVDVYHMAAIIGKHFESITDELGGAVFSDVMPKIIYILEALEAVVTKIQNESFTESELYLKVKKLEADNMFGNQKHQQEIESLENAWKEESSSLLATLKNVEQDNARISALMSEKLEEDNYRSPPSMDRQDSMYQSLIDDLDKKKNELATKCRLVNEQNEEIEALTLQQERLTKLNGEMRRKINLLEQQGRNLITEKSNLDADLNEKRRHIKDLQNRLQGLSPDSKNALTPESNEDNNNIMKWPDPLMDNKLVIDLDDPDRPRYTLHELQEVLTERNDLKLKYFLLEEEFNEQRGGEWEHLEESVNVEEDPPPVAESSIKRLFASLFGQEKPQQKVQLQTNETNKVNMCKIDSNISNQET